MYLATLYALMLDLLLRKVDQHSFKTISCTKYKLCLLYKLYLFGFVAVCVCRSGSVWGHWHEIYGFVEQLTYRFVR